MRADLADGVASRVLVWRSDRLHRRNAELESWIGEIAEPYGVNVHSVQAGGVLGDNHAVTAIVVLDAGGHRPGCARGGYPNWNLISSASSPMLLA